MPSSYTPAIATPVTPPNGGTGVANNAASTLTISGNFGTTFTVTGATALTLPTSGTLVTTTTLGNGTLAASLTTITASTQLILPNGSSGTPAILFASANAIYANNTGSVIIVTGNGTTSVICSSGGIAVGNGGFYSFGATNAQVGNNGNNIKLLGGNTQAGTLEISDAIAAFSVAVKTLVTVVGSLPAAATAGVGARAFVTDGSTTLILGLGLAVTGGGANKVPVYSDGTNWIVG